MPCQPGLDRLARCTHRRLENSVSFRKAIALGSVPAFLGLSATETSAQAYPVKVVRYIVPMGAGSGADTIGRIVAAGLAEVSRQQVIVDNRVGAAGNIGADVAAKAPADGYSLFQVSSTHAINASLYRNLTYDLVRDFAPVTQLAFSPSVVVVHPSVPVKSVPELVRFAKARPGQMNYGSTGPGSATFLAAELFKSMSQVDIVHVPYRSGGEALTGIVAGETSVYFAPLAPTLPFIRQGRVRPLAVTTSQRLVQLPELPTVAEAGYKGYQAGNWYGILVPAKAAREVVAAVRTAVVAGLNEAATRKRLVDLGYIIVGDQPEEFGAFIKSEIGSFAEIIRQSGISAQ
jgi:tripartite-type tricarboxylate transporter receptor subunit TctC